MPYLKKWFLILTYFLFFVTGPIVPIKTIDCFPRAESAERSFIAKIRVEKAIVYKDENLLSPIGYLPLGKTIQVGLPSDKNKKIVPLKVKGDTAYIEISMLEFLDNEKEFEKKSPDNFIPTEHNFDSLIPPPPDNLTKNNSVIVTIERSEAGNEVKNTFSEVDGSGQSGFWGLKAQVIHRYSQHLFFMGLGFEYQSISSPGLRFRYFMLTPTVGYTFLKNEDYTLDALGSFSFSTNTKLEIATPSTVIHRGFLWGFQAEARGIFLPNKKYHPSLGLGLKRYAVNDLSTITDSNGQDRIGFKQILGLYLAFGVAFDI